MMLVARAVQEARARRQYGTLVSEHLPFGVALANALGDARVTVTAHAQAA